MSKITNYRKSLILERDNYTCHYCKIKSNDVKKVKAKRGADITVARITGQVFAMEIDHKIPVSNGGSNDLENLVACCWRCNNKKGVVPYKVFIEQYV